MTFSDEIQELFFEYLNEEDFTITEAFDAVLGICLNENDFSDDDSTYVVENILLPSIIGIFACVYSDGDLDIAFESFCESEGIDDEDFQEVVSIAMAEAVQDDYPDWPQLSGNERIKATKAFLRKLNGSTPGPDKTFLDTHSQKSPAARTLDVNEAIVNANKSGQGYDDSHVNHVFHPILIKHGYGYSHSTPVHSRDGTTVHTHHTYAKGQHKLGFYHGSENFTSKTSSASGHSWQGSGPTELDKHLANKAKRYHYNETTQIETIPILEGLFDTSRVASYVSYMNRNAYKGDPNKNNPAFQQLNEKEEARKLKDQSDKTFDYTKKPDEELQLISTGRGYIVKKRET